MTTTVLVSVTRGNKPVKVDVRGRDADGKFNPGPEPVFLQVGECKEFTVYDTQDFVVTEVDKV